MTLQIFPLFSNQYDMPKIVTRNIFFKKVSWEFKFNLSKLLIGNAIFSWFWSSELLSACQVLYSSVPISFLGQIFEHIWLCTWTGLQKNYVRKQSAVNSKTEWGISEWPITSCQKCCSNKLTAWTTLSPWELSWVGLTHLENAGQTWCVPFIMNPSFEQSTGELNIQSNSQRQGHQPALSLLQGQGRKSCDL